DADRSRSCVPCRRTARSSPVVAGARSVLLQRAVSLDRRRGEVRSTPEIHDLGYQRYDGIRRPASTRWQVIMRHQIAFGWVTWWRYKLALVLAVITTCVCGALLYFLRSETITALAPGGAALKLADVLLPVSINFFCKIAF